MQGSKITAPDLKKFDTEISLPFSKSESNRALIINALSGNVCTIENLSDADDTVLLKRLLSSNSNEINCENAGTVLRFLTTYYCITQQEKIITGNERMQQRPIGKLVDALKTLGADITYLKEDGFPPVKVKPAALNKTNKVIIDASESSQFVSALMMMAPILNKGLEIALTGEVSSQPYIAMTAQMMQQAGIKATLSGKKISIKKQNFTATHFKINSDWSSAAFMYEIAALSDESEILINNLTPNDLQGDEVVKEIFKSFGVTTSVAKEGLIIKKSKQIEPDYFTFNFNNTPDLALPVAATCGGLNIVSDLHGLKNLVIKESNRAYAFQREAYKLNIKTDFCDFSKLKILERSQIQSTQKVIKTYNDHRMAMSFAPLALQTDYIEIDDAECVSKSFPNYFDVLKHLGFKLVKQ
jgi:3-phosphoshikimate 1-carboxyvinyltransferase